MKISARTHLPFFIIFTLFLIVGIFIHDDYGISWDGTACRNDMGIVNWNRIVHGDQSSLEKSDAKYHGPAFEILLYGIEKLSGHETLREVFFQRHLLTFFLFAVSVIFFYLLVSRYLDSRWLGCLGTVFLILSPRIFSDAFYNSKDAAFLSVMIIGAYTCLRFLENKTLRNAIIHALVSAIIVDIRIMGVIIPFLTLLFLLADFIKLPALRKKIILTGLAYSFLLVPFIILFWPVLWQNPVEQFILAWQENSKYPWNKNILYMGNIIPATGIPWHYVPVWILISTPILYSALFLSGTISAFRRAILLVASRAESLHILLFFLPVVAVIVLRSVVFDGWRHMYFVYPAFLFIALSGLKRIESILRHKSIMITVLRTVIIVYCTYMLYTMIRLHPYQNVYFNSFAGKNLAQARTNFESDYWGVSYREALEYLLKTDTAETIRINSSERVPLFDNTLLLKPHERSRISFMSDHELSDYFITAYRTKPSLHNLEPHFSIVRDNGIVLSVFDFRRLRKNIFTDNFRVAEYINDFELQQEIWQSGNIQPVSDAFSGQHVDVLDSHNIYSSGINIQLPVSMADTVRLRNYLSVSFMAKSAEAFGLSVVCQLDSGSNSMYAWKSGSVSITPDTWRKYIYQMLMPVILSSETTLKVYLWNKESKRVSIDKLNISLYSVPVNQMPDIPDSFYGAALPY